MTDPTTIPERESDAPPTWVPIEACTLPTVDQPVRAAEFDVLFAETLATVEQGSTANARFVLIGGAALAERARGLADRETGCCSFFAFTVTRSGADSVVMDVVVPDERTAVLAALVQRARDAREGADGGRTA